MLLLSNLPHDCSEREVHAWIESKGISALSIRIVRDDHPTGGSPAFGDVELDRTASVREAARLLNGTRMQGRIIQVREAAAVPRERTLLARRTPDVARGISHTEA